MLCLRKQQEDDEDGAVEEMDTSDEEEVEDDDYEDENSESEHRTESGSCDDQENHAEGSGSSSSTRKRKYVYMSGKEKDLLREEFVSNMYRSFLEGRDEEFDYRLVFWKYIDIYMTVQPAKWMVKIPHMKMKMYILKQQWDFLVRYSIFFTLCSTSNSI